MLQSEIKKVVIDQKEELQEFIEGERVIPRALDGVKLKAWLRQPNVLVISGVRRSGKSTLAVSLLQGEIFGYINFDDERLLSFTSEDFNKLLQVFYEIYGGSLEYFIFDEIQNISGWEVFISRLRRTKKVIITGSNANLLSGELATHLTGRYIDFILYPFSFKEFLTLKNVEFQGPYSTKITAQLKNLLEEYVKEGGFPETYKFGSPIVKRIYGDILTKDILLRYKVKKRAAFRELARYLITNFAQRFSFSKLKNVFGIGDVHTVKNYVDYLTDSFLICVLEKFSFKLKNQFLAPRKAYGIDTGLINSLAFKFIESEGRFMENLVFLEILRRKSYFDESLEVYYWQGSTQEEIDFVVQKNGVVTQLIQVSHDISNQQTKEREIKALVKASDELKCLNLLLITSDMEGEETVDGKVILCVPLWQWLLN